MKAGSLQNLMADNAINPVQPEVGMGATRISWTDRHAATIIEVSRTGHKIVVQDDKATRSDSNGMSDAQSYEFEPNPNGSTNTYTRRKDGSYRQLGGNQRLIVGYRDHYYDFSF